MKVPGLGEFCPPPPYRQPVPLARMAVDAFGPQRLMWGSDFPPVSSRQGYANALHGSMDHLSDLRPEALAWDLRRHGAARVGAVNPVYPSSGCRQPV